MHVTTTIAEIQKGQGLGSGYEWLAGLVSRVCMAGSLQGLHGGLNIMGSKYHMTLYQGSRFDT